MITLIADVAGLKFEVNEIKSIDFPMLWVTVDFNEVPSSDVPAISNIFLDTVPKMLP